MLLDLILNNDRPFNTLPIVLIIKKVNGGEIIRKEKVFYSNLVVILSLIIGFLVSYWLMASSKDAIEIIYPYGIIGLILVNIHVLSKKKTKMSDDVLDSPREKNNL
ncbi:MAG TPA: hypothetical protein EYG86_07400 [Crocinitomicaceae bacterium]|nr:hypothetical protein [Crocinitomicaceae bacterium]